jgi:hypothetical protein
MRRYTDIPMAAMWMYPGRDAPNPTYVFDHLGAASVAHVYGQNIAAAESLTCIRLSVGVRATRSAARHGLAVRARHQTASSCTRPFINRCPIGPRHVAAHVAGSILQSHAKRGPSRPHRGSITCRATRSCCSKGSSLPTSPTSTVRNAALTGLQPQDSPRGFGLDFVNDDVVLNSAESRGTAS